MSLPSLVVLGREPGACLLLTLPLPVPTSDLLDGPLTSQIQRLRRTLQGKELKNSPMCRLDKKEDKSETVLTQALPTPQHCSLNGRVKLQDKCHLSPGHKAGLETSALSVENN